MTHEPIRVIHFSPHITWQGTQAELDAMLAEGWPDGSASEIIAACKRDAAEAEAYAAELEAKLAKAVDALVQIVGKRYYADDPWGIARTTLAELKGENDE
jgi:hypothetical protein